ncbi:phage tail protein [Sphingomonas sp. So64.6b]|uniref:phage tail protein n=1 Tax=Sphingomonas sp. So64.6b TaxID=2997354 RepID=UPI0016042DB9|nr:tail fiber protein [Sphingomonas sp. So64.6b]QNA83310.1 phage tail protein [Sphingomonas sp. So64.6b]
MAQPFLGQIVMTGFNFAPRFHATCDGQLLSIAQNTALFSLLGTTYGGNGTTTFQLPDLRGRTPVHRGQGPGLPNVTLGESDGQEKVTLLTTEIPAHQHDMIGTSNPGDRRPASGNTQAPDSRADVQFYSPATNLVQLSPSALGTVGTNAGHENMQPFGVINFAIALSGIFPSRN